MPTLKSKASTGNLRAEYARGRDNTAERPSSSSSTVTRISDSAQSRPGRPSSGVTTIANSPQTSRPSSLRHAGDSSSSLRAEYGSSGSRRSETSSFLCSSATGSSNSGLTYIQSDRQAGMRTSDYEQSHPQRLRPADNAGPSFRDRVGRPSTSERGAIQGSSQSAYDNRGRGGY